VDAGLYLKLSLSLQGWNACSWPFILFYTHEFPTNPHRYACSKSPETVSKAGHVHTLRMTYDSIFCGERTLQCPEVKWGFRLRFQGRDLLRTQNLSSYIYSIEYGLLLFSLMCRFASNGGVSKSGQTPVLSCNQPLDIRAMMLMIWKPPACSWIMENRQSCSKDALIVSIYRF